jgi:glycosyltransferase involved in cell wall biosynthesis
MPLMHPLISICIPTYNRADLLDYCLNNLAAALEGIGRPAEIVISDNGSTDRTPKVIEAHRAKNPAIRAHRMPENRGGAANWLNAMYKSEGEFLAYLADDDSLVAEGLAHHIARLEREPDLVAIYADWIAWDDKEERELHRHYNGLTEFTSFAPSAPLDLINFMLKRFYPPEIGVYRRDAVIRSHSFHGRSLPHYLSMYRLSRLGRIGFDPLPFYREHRGLKDRFQRTHWANMSMQYHMIGDELRLSLEEMVLMGLQDAGASHLNAEQAQVVRQSIERILHMRLQLEVERACGRQDWITAVELRRRHVLWHGPGSDEDARRDALKIIIPAALQAVKQTLTSLSGATGISLRGFESERVSDFYRDHFPGTPVYPAGDRTNGAATLIVHRDEQTLVDDETIHDPSDVMVLERLLDLYRITQARIDLKGL